MTEEQALIAFYGNKEDLDPDDCLVLVRALHSRSLVDIMSIIAPHYRPYIITSSDVPQFSSLDDCFRVPILIELSGLPGVDYNTMGYLLRTKNRKEGADKKYGENAGKMAVMFGLCALDKITKPFRFRTTSLGRLFTSLTDDERDSLKPYFCIRPGIIQNYFMQVDGEASIEKDLHTLTSKTKKRRLSNVKTLISIVKTARESEL